MSLTVEQLRGLRLLIVEDEALIALTLEDMLDNLGCVIAGVAGTLARAMILAGELTIDGAVLDINLGGEMVYPAAARLRARGVPFVFCTGYGKTGLAQEFAQVPTLSKPYSEGELQALLMQGVIGRGAKPFGQGSLP